MFATAWQIKSNKKKICLHVLFWSRPTLEGSVELPSCQTLHHVRQLVPDKYAVIAYFFKIIFKKKQQKKVVFLSCAKTTL